MRSGAWLVVLVLGLVAGCKPQPAQRQAADGTAGKPAPPWVLGEPVRHENLTIFPVISAVARNDDRFITLDEGLKSGQVEVLEVGAATGNAPPQSPPARQAPAQRPAAPNGSGNPPPAAAIPQPLASPGDPAAQPLERDPFSGAQSADQSDEPAFSANDVNRLVVVNRSKKPLYLMPGEILLGGDQDRVVGQELVVQPGGKPTQIDVFCVEHGRWGRRGEEETRSLLVASGGSSGVASIAGAESEDAVADAVRQADRGKFVASLGSLSKSVRQSVQSSGLEAQPQSKQSEVWDKVQQANAASKVTSDSDAFTANYSQKEAVDRLAPYLAKLEKPIADRERVLGVVVAINGKPQMLDLFESTPLFRKLWPKLLKSYALDATHVADVRGAGVGCPPDAARAFVSAAQQARVDKQDQKAGVCLVRRSSGQIEAYSAAEPAAVAEGQGLGGGAFGGAGAAIHSSAFSK